VGQLLLFVDRVRSMLYTMCCTASVMLLIQYIYRSTTLRMNEFVRVQTAL